MITKDDDGAGQRHAALAGHEGEIAIRAWAGNPTDPKTQTGGVTWILADDWVPYQLPTFVTPAFQGFVSGHSTFSRAAAEVMTAFTGSEYFPGGISGYTIEAGLAQGRGGPDAPTSAWSGRRTTTRPTRPGSRGCTAASTSRPTTSTVGSSAPSAARTRGHSRSGCTARARRVG